MKYSMPKNIVSRIVLVLDESGSMSSQRSDVIGGINETIRQQRLELPEDSTTNFTVVTFSDSVNSPIDHKLSSIPYFTDRDFRPSGSTALYDAIGFTIERFKSESNVIFLVMTDGEENASKHFTHHQVTQLIQKIKDTKNWNFIYLSEDISTFKQGEQLGYSSRAVNCNNILTGKNKLGSALGDMNCQRAISDMRKGGANIKIQATVSMPTPEPYFQPQPVQTRNWFPMFN
jgi:uncharacterized protein YegL